jgi:hypothetical protein
MLTLWWGLCAFLVTFIPHKSEMRWQEPYLTDEKLRHEDAKHRDVT